MTTKGWILFLLLIIAVGFWTKIYLNNQSKKIDEQASK